MDWRQQAACHALDAEIFFPVGRSGHLTDAAVRPALRVCDRCPVRQPCLGWALTHDVQGIWGGTTDRDRRALRRAESSGPTSCGTR